MVLHARCTRCTVSNVVFQSREKHVLDPKKGWCRAERRPWAFGYLFFSSFVLVCGGPEFQYGHTRVHLPPPPWRCCCFVYVGSGWMEWWRSQLSSSFQTVSPVGTFFSMGRGRATSAPSWWCLGILGFVGVGLPPRMRGGTSIVSFTVFSRNG